MPLRDNLCPNDLRSSPLLRTTRGLYFGRSSTDTNPNKPSFGEMMDHMDLDARDACAGFLRRLCWHKRWLVGLVPKIEGISDSHPLDLRCPPPDPPRLCGVVSNRAESRQSLIHALKLWKMTSGSPKRYSP